VVQVDGRTGKTLSRWALPSDVRVLSLAGSEVWAGTDDGLLFRATLGGESPVLFSDAMKGAPVLAVQRDATGLYCVAGRDLVVLSPSGALLRRRPGMATEHFVLCDAGILLAQGAQEIVLLDRAELRVIESYGLDEDVAFLVLGNGFPFVFGRHGKFFRLDPALP